MGLDSSPRERFGYRFGLLEDSGQTTPSARDMCVRFIEAVEHEFDVQLREDNAAMFVTHVVMALSRLERGEPEAAATVTVEDLDECQEELAFIRRLVPELTQPLQHDVPEAELLYMAAHLCALRQQSQ